MNFSFTEFIADFVYRTLQKIQRNLKHIFIFALMGLVIGLFYAMGFYSPLYTASSELLINNADKPNVIGTHMELLKSTGIADKVSKEINERYNLNLPEEKRIAEVKKALSVENIPNTDIIKVKAMWNNPAIAQQIVSATIDEYKTLNNKTTINEFSKIRQVLHEKVKNEEKNLLLLDNKLNEQNSNTNTNYLVQSADYTAVMNDLKTRLIESELEEARSMVDVNIINTPDVSTTPVFPGKFQLALLFALLSGYMGLKITLTKEFFKNSFTNSDQIEKETGERVLGIIPWLDKDAYEEPDVMFAIGETASAYSLAYQKTVSNIRMLGNLYEKKVLGFTSSEASKLRSTIIMNIACGLSKTTQSVIVVDADFRTPTVAKEMDFEENNGYSLENLLEEISLCLKNARPFDESRVALYIRSVHNTNNFFVLPNTSCLPDPSEYLYSHAFSMLIRILKKRFDWVFIDTPPVLAVPDAMAISSQTDGMIITTGLETKKQTLKKILKQFRSYKINVFGIISREMDVSRSFSSNEYIRQMFARLMPQNEDILT